VHVALKALYWPGCGWVITVFWSSSIVPPPTGISLAFSGPDLAGVVSSVLAALVDVDPG
jgi:hypothetical protein